MAELLRDADSTDRHLDVVRRHMRLSHRVPGAEHFAPVIEPVRNTLIGDHAVTVKAEEAVEDARDDILFDDKKLDREVKTTFERAGEYDSAHPGKAVQPVLFPGGGFTPITRSPVATENKLVAGLIARITALGADHPLQEWAGKLQTKLDGSLGSAAKFAAAYLKLGEAKAKEEMAQFGLRRQYEANYYDAMKELGDAGEDIFPHFRSSKASEPQPPVAPASPTR